MSKTRFPTFADVHVHLREPGATQKEDFETGTKAAVAGGYTLLLDMPNNNPPTVTIKNLKQKETLARNRIWCDVGFNFGATQQSIQYFQKVYNKVFAIKIYMNKTTGPLLIESRKERDEIFKNWPGDKPIMVHAENETVETAIGFAAKYHKKLHICHVTFDQILAIKKAKKRGVKISCEVTPHHLFLSKRDLSRLGNFGMMKPPLLTESEKNKLWAVVEHIDMISTDHAPHTIEEKADSLTPKFGVPGLETTFSLMMQAAKEGMISQEKVIQMMSTNPKKIFNLPIQADTYLEVDLNVTFKIGEKKLFTKCQWTPFKNLSGRGLINKVVLRGATVFENGVFLDKPSGIIIKPS